MKYKTGQPRTLACVSAALFTLIVSAGQSMADEAPAKTIQISVAGEPLEIYEGSVISDFSGRYARKSLFREKFISDIVSYLTGQHALKGYDEEISRTVAENMLDASVVAKILPKPELKRLAKIKGATVAVFVDEDGRIHFKEILVYDPKTPIYCQGQGRPSVRTDSSIPCLSKKRSKRERGQKKTPAKLSKQVVEQQKLWSDGGIPDDAREIVESWRVALRDAARAQPVKKVLGMHPGELLEFSDQALWAIIWSQSQQTLIQAFTFLPKYGSKITGDGTCSRETYSDSVCKQAEDQNLPPQQVQDEQDQIEEEYRQEALTAAEIRQWCDIDACWNNCGTHIPSDCEQQFLDKCDEFEFTGEDCNPAMVRQEQQERDQIAAELARQRRPNSGSVPLITGFTWDENERWEKTKRTCVDYNPLWPGCTRYHIKAYYRYSYAFGLRIPLLLEVQSINVREEEEGLHTGRLRITLTPVDGNEDHYRDAGMLDRQIYEGREALASLCNDGGCAAGLEANVPGPNFDLGPYTINEINLLHKAFSSGRIRRGEINPPDVSDEETLGLKRIDFDLMGGFVSAGIVGAELLPVFRLDMGGIEKTLGTAYDDRGCAGSPQTRLRWTRPGSHKVTSFEIQDDNRVALLYDPSYTFDLTLRLGLEPTIWVDFGVWGDEWTIAQVWLPWGINSPNFTLDQHANTRACGLRFLVTRQTN